MSDTTFQSATSERPAGEVSIPRVRQAELLLAERHVFDVIPFEVDMVEVAPRSVEAPAPAPQPEQPAVPTPVESDQTVHTLDIDEVRKAVAEIQAAPLNQDA